MWAMSEMAAFFLLKRLISSTWSEGWMYEKGYAAAFVGVAL
jgi:hypothetical protein